MDSTCLKLELCSSGRVLFKDAILKCAAGQGVVVRRDANVAKGMLMSQSGANLLQHSQST